MSIKSSTPAFVFHLKMRVLKCAANKMGRSKDWGASTFPSDTNY